MKKCIFEGCATAIVTPMHPDGSVNEQGFRDLVEQQIIGGIDALVVCGTTGESAVLNHEEHLKVIEIAVKQNAGRVPIIAGTGSNDTAYAVELSKDALKIGADALLMVTPYYNKTSQAGIIAHYNYVADRVDAPIIVYNVPSRTGVNIKPETYLELSKHPNIVAAKEANGDISSVLKTMSLCGDDLTIYSGNDDQIVPIMSLYSKKYVLTLFPQVRIFSNSDVILSFEILQATDIVSVVKNYLKNSRNLHNIFLSSIVKVLLKTQSLDSIKLSADKFSEA